MSRYYIRSFPPEFGVGIIRIPPVVTSYIFGTPSDSGVQISLCSVFMCLSLLCCYNFRFLCPRSSYGMVVISENRTPRNSGK